MPTFKGLLNNGRLTGDGFIAEKFDGIASLELKKINGKPSSVKVISSAEKSDMRVSVQYVMNGAEHRTESFPAGNCVFDLSGFEDGYYHIIATAKNAENVSLRYELN